MAKYLTKVFCIAFVFCCAAITPSTCSSNETDVLALLAFKAAIVDPLGALSSWDNSRDHCNWNGIRCGSKHPDRVVEINLTSRGLVGSLSPYVGNLSFLRKINLKNNSFNGQIPEEIGRLRRLEFVKLSNNSFVGEIPRNISQCPNLVYLNLVQNSLSGIIPHDLGSLHKLEQLGLAENNLVGYIPPFLGNLTFLKHFSVAACKLRGEIPESLAQLQSLKTFILSNNNLTGRIPSGVFNVSSLDLFYVDNNQLQGVIPDNIGLTFPNLRHLYLGNNQFTGKLPVSLSNVTSFEIISLEYNSFNGPIPRELGKLSNLEHFLVAINLVEDDTSFIASFTNCTNLQSLVVSGNIIRGSLPDSISNLSSQIESLQLSETQLHGNIPSGIGNLNNLILLYLSDNNLEGPIPFSIGKLSNLRHLFLDTNQFTDEIPHSLGNLTLLNILNLQGNSMSGSIPHSLGNCTSLLTLNLAHNNLSGSITPHIMNLSSISVSFNLSYNRFMGSIPIEVGALTHLADLDLSYNELSGLIPNSLSGCASLQKLHLDGNLLQGEIPLALSALKGLQELDLSRNNLSGRIPIFLGHLDLQYLNLSFNRFKGEVPIEGIFRNNTIVSLEGNMELCGGIHELKLPPCTSSNSSAKDLPRLLKILIPTLVAGGLSITLCVCLCIYIHHRRISMKESPPTGPFDGSQFMRLSYRDLFKATSGFSEDNLVGVGRFGFVYRGILKDGKTKVAVKVLNLSVKGASKSFISECLALKGIKHRNLLKLLSVCEGIDFQRNEFKALIYEFMANGSLEDLLHHNIEPKKEHDAKFQSLGMFQRLKISIDVAHALEYLHFGTDSPIIHGDLKPNNILLDDDMTAHVGDFGLSKVVSNMIEATESSSTIGIKGTIGYVPPEYGMGNPVSMQGDLYSYGILILEMFTGKRPTDQGFDENIDLHSFVVNALPNNVTEIVDPFIQEVHDMNHKVKDCVASILSIGVACSSKVPMDRMCSTDVVNGLCKIRDYYIADI